MASRVGYLPMSFKKLKQQMGAFLLGCSAWNYLNTQNKGFRVSKHVDLK